MSASIYSSGSSMQEFKLYETHSKFYIVGRNKDRDRALCRVLKIDRLEPSDLNIREDSVIYSEVECYDLLRRINEGNKPTGGLKFVTTCYGIVGFIKFLEPYYMLLITKRRKIGAIGGHAVFSIVKSAMIPIPNSTVRSKIAYSEIEKRYKNLLGTLDLTKDFFFSYSYHVTCSLQKNICDSKSEQFMYETMFVWNEFLTREIRIHLKNTLWTVALVHGFFKQVKISISARYFNLTLIARRSRHFAGTRYLKRGVNEKGRVANDVETEQIVFEDVPKGCLLQISSIVQNRGSIPLFWSQETSRLNIKPDIILSKKDQNYDATRLHFENLLHRYGNPIIVLNLIKSREKRPRESILRAEFANSMNLINKKLSDENRLKFLHWDLHKQTRNKAVNVLSLLGKIASYALNITGIFYCQVPPTLMPGRSLNQPYFGQKNAGDSECFLRNHTEKYKDTDNLDGQVSNSGGDVIDLCIKPSMFQKGILRTNCIDCLDRTNVAQYAYGLAALGHQLYALEFIAAPNINLDTHLASDLMELYEMMGDTLALQYGGSAAHNKIFSERRGQWKAATQSQEFFRTLQRYYSNAYTDSEKQDSINIFLGHFQPQQDQPALWELDFNRHYNIGRSDPSFIDEDTRSFFKRSLSDCSNLCESNSHRSLTNPGEGRISYQPFENSQRVSKDLFESAPVIPASGSDVSYSRYTPLLAQRQIFIDSQRNQHLERDQICFHEHGDAFNCSNFLDVDLISSGNSRENETYERSTLINSPISNRSFETAFSETSSKGRDRLGNGIAYDMQHSPDTFVKYPDSFMDWVSCGELLFL